MANVNFSILLFGLWFGLYINTRLEVQCIFYFTLFSVSFLFVHSSNQIILFIHPFTNTFTFTAGFYFDLPYGLQVPTFGSGWDDEAPSDEWLDKMFNMLGVYFGRQKHFAAFMVHFTQVAQMVKHMDAHGYKNVETLYVYKPMHNMTGVNTFINAVEIIVVGWKPNRNAVGLNWKNHELNPLYRHNVIYSPPVTARYETSSVPPQLVNQTEKHPWIAQRLGEILANPGDTILVAGAGSGSDCLGFIRAGCNIIAVEKDKRQFKELRRRFQMENDNHLTVDIDTKYWKKCVAQLKEQSSTVGTYFNLKKQDEFNKLKADAKTAAKASKSNAKASKEKGMAGAPSGDEVRSEPAKKVKAPVQQKCADCGQPLDEKSVKCALASCPVMIHKVCSDDHPCIHLADKDVDPAGCALTFCSDSCSGAHVCSSLSEMPSADE